jgi:hypothetical protein
MYICVKILIYDCTHLYINMYMFKNIYCIFILRDIYDGEDETVENKCYIRYIYVYIFTTYMYIDVDILIYEYTHIQVYIYMYK